LLGEGRERSGRRLEEDLPPVVDAHGDPVEVLMTEAVGHARELAKAAVRRGARLVLAWGGDGTINEVVSALAFDDVPLGIVPAGSGNGLARELGVHSRPERAIADALQAVPRAMDLGEIDGRLFANVAGIGFDAHIASRFATATRRGFVGYAGITMRALRSYAPQHYRISVEGVETTHRAILVTIANSAQFGNNARIAPGARVDDGELDLVVVEERSRIATICQVPRLFNGTANRIRGCTIRRIRAVTIESEQPMAYHVDGEPIAGGTRLKARIHPGALMVAVR
jgi:YegS/Rv2252/BmrU family lipid kinase